MPGETATLASSMSSFENSSEPRVRNSSGMGAHTNIVPLGMGTFQPIQIAGIVALENDQKCVEEINEMYRRRRDVLVDGLNKHGWQVAKPKGTMFVWAPIPDQYRGMGSLEFSKMLIQECKVAVSPGIGFGEYGEGFVRFALVENEQRIKQALRGLRTLTAAR